MTDEHSQAEDQDEAVVEQAAVAVDPAIDAIEESLHSVEDLVDEEPAAEEPAVEDPAGEESVVEEPVAVGPATEKPAAEAPASEALPTPTWPFIAYVALWAVFAGVLVWRFSSIPSGQPVFESPLYPLSVFVGVVLAVAGPLLSLATWAGLSVSHGASRWSTFVSTSIKGSIATLVGVTLWWIALVVIDQLRLGRIL